jgi:hypothetical protein
MSSLLNLLNSGTGNLSLVSNNINAQPNSPAWGYIDATSNLDPAASRLQNTYDVNGIPNVKLVDFNHNGVTTVKGQSTLDELDANAPKNTQAGGAGSVVSQIYKSTPTQQYKQKGPQPGRY